MKINIYLCVVLFILQSFSCNNSNNLNTNLDREIIASVDLYIKENPLNLPIEKDLFKNGYSYPSYNVHFNIKGLDTIMSILQTPHFTGFVLDGSIDDDGIEFYDSLEPNGFIIYKEKFPLIFFGLENYDENIENHLVKSIPDSLKFNERNYHLTIVRWDFKLENGKFMRIPKLNNFHTQPSRD